MYAYYKVQGIEKTLNTGAGLPLSRRPVRWI